MPFKYTVSARDIWVHRPLFLAPSLLARVQNFFCPSPNLALKSVRHRTYLSALHHAAAFFVLCVALVRQFGLCPNSLPSLWLRLTCAQPALCGGPSLGFKSLAQTRPAAKCRLASTLGLTSTARCKASPTQKPREHDTFKLGISDQSMSINLPSFVAAHFCHLQHATNYDTGQVVSKLIVMEVCMMLTGQHGSGQLFH